MKKTIRGFICGFIVAGCLFVIPAVAESVQKSIDVLVDYVTVTIDGQKVDVPNFVNDGTTYLGLRAMANALGFEVQWDEDTATAIITTSKNSTVLTVNGQAIKQDEFDAVRNEAKFYYSQFGYNVGNDELKESAKQQLIGQTVILQKAKELGIAATDEDNQAVSEQLSMIEMQNGGAEALDKMFQQQGTTREKYTQYLLEYRIQDKLFEHLKKNDPEYTKLEQDAKTYYEQNKDTIKNPTVTVKHILIPEGEGAKEKADEIYAKLLKGADFDALLKDNNNDPGLTDAGYVVDKNTNFVQEFKDAALLLKKGEISPVVKTSYGYHIIKALDATDVVTLDEYVKSYTDEKINELNTKNVQSWIDSADVIVNEEVYKSL